MSPKVTIGVPVRNGEVHLAKALEALLSQDMGDFELLISDNASTDGTEEIGRSYAARDKRVQYHRNERNLGAPDNYNNLVHRAQGEFFRWACHDDLCAPNHLSSCLRAFEEGPEGTVLAYPKTVIIDRMGQEVRRYEDNSEVLQPRAQDRVAHMIEALYLCNAVVGLCRVDAMRKTGLIGAYNGCDHVLLAELALLGPIVEVPEHLFFRRIDDSLGSYTNTGADVDERAAWLGRKRLSFPATTMAWHHVRALLQLPASPMDRVRSAWVAARILGFRKWRTIGGEFKFALKSSLGLTARP